MTHLSRIQVKMLTIVFLTLSALMTFQNDAYSTKQEGIFTSHISKELREQVFSNLSDKDLCSLAVTTKDRQAEVQAFLWGKTEKTFSIRSDLILNDHDLIWIKSLFSTGMLAKAHHIEINNSTFKFEWIQYLPSTTETLKLSNLIWNEEMDLEFASNFASKLGKLQNLKSIELVGCNLGLMGALAVSQALPKLSKLHALSIDIKISKDQYTEQGSSSGCTMLFRSLPKILNLKTLKISKIFFIASQTMALAETICDLKNLQNFELIDCEFPLLSEEEPILEYLGDDLREYLFAQPILSNLGELENLKSLKISGIHLEYEHLRFFIKALPKLEKLENLDLACSHYCRGAFEKRNPEELLSNAVGKKAGLKIKVSEPVSD